jgi:hypothetical protein
VVKEATLHSVLEVPGSTVVWYDYPGGIFSGCHSSQRSVGTVSYVGLLPLTVHYSLSDLRSYMAKLQTASLNKQ